jgi:hypothetical protein
MRQFISPLALVALITTVLRAQGAASGFKLSFQRVSQGAETPNRTGYVSGTWSALEKGGFCLILRQKAGTFIGSFGPDEHRQIPLLDLSVREGVVRFTIGEMNVELTLKDDLLEGRITQPDLEPLSKFAVRLDDPSIEYRSRPLSDPVSELNRRIQAGEVRLKRDCTHGYLQSVLDAFHVPIESQVAVFSKTSLQRERINPRNPRTIFFNDEVSIGWVPGGEVIELAAQDPQQGVIFYKLDQKRADNPQIRAQRQRLRGLSHAGRCAWPSGI